VSWLILSKLDITMQLVLSKVNNTCLDAHTSDGNSNETPMNAD